MPDNTELELVARFKAGDLSVFNTLTRMWYEKILSLLYRVLGDIDEAEDVCQKTFITVYFRLHQLNDNGKFGTWLYRIANNCAIDHIRERKNSFRGNGRIHPDGSDETSDIPEGDPVDMEGRIDGTALRRLCEESLGSIPEEQRVVIVMKMYQDLKFTEIAEVLNVPVNTVKTRMYTGLRTMKDILNKNRLIEEILRNAL
jgi:RNA polymerase sigma-70 factor, ECF subfamily